MIKKTIGVAVRGTIGLAARTRLGRFCLDQAVTQLMRNTWPVLHAGTSLVFTVPNRLNWSRVDTFSTKEPETLGWLDAIPKGSVLWDIGANIGLYSCYAAKARACQVFAFEPSVFNLELLARNVAANRLQDRITIVPLPLSDALSISTLNLTTTEWGGAMSTFDKDYTHDGSQIKTVFEFRTIGLPMDEAARRLGIPVPDYIKMDVDGIEHLILKGGTEVLASARGILIEINDKFQMQAVDSARALRAAGLTMKAKRHSAIFDGTALETSYNQIWFRDGSLTESKSTA